MASESKKRKADCNTHYRKRRFTDLACLKWKRGSRGVIFYNSVQRQGIKQETKKFIEEYNRG